MNKKKVPEGKTFYVLRRERNTTKIEIWDPQTGTPYTLNCGLTYKYFLCLKIGTNKSVIERGTNETIPLYRVGCLYNHEKIYINN